MDETLRLTRDAFPVRWRQFSLRTLLLVPIGCGAIIPWTERARRQNLLRG